MAGLSHGLSGIALSSLRQLSAALQQGEFRRWASAYIAQYAKEHGHFCPDCYQKHGFAMDVIPAERSDFSASTVRRSDAKTARAECRRNAGTDLQYSAARTVSGSERLPAIVLLFSFDAVRGNILHLSSNFTLLSAGKSLHYHWKGIAPPEGENGDIIHRIAIKERQFYSAVSSMRFSMARRRLNVTRKEQYFARSLRRMVIFGC